MAAHPLLDSTVTETSKSQARTILALTIAHEIMHGIRFGQRRLNLATGTHPDPHYTRETVCHFIDLLLQFFPLAYQPQFMFDELVSEMGESFENNVFGGMTDVHAHPVEGYRFTASTNGAILLMTNSKWPALKYGTWERHSIHSLPEFPCVVETSAVPALYTCGTSTRNFWETNVAKYGIDALMMPRAFVSKVTTGFGMSSAPAVWSTDFETIPPLERPLKQMARRIQHRRKQYEQWRPWYKGAYEEWRATPFGNVRNRNDLYKILNQHLVNRTHADERDIIIIIQLWLTPFFWPDAGCEGLLEYVGDGEVGDKRSWFYRAMGMLITAVLPIHFDPVVVNPREGHHPEASEARCELLFSIADSAYHESDPIENSPDFVLSFPGSAFDGPDGNPLYNIVNSRSPRDLRRHFVNEAIGFFKIYESLCPVPLGLKEAFNGAVKDLMQQIENYSNPLPNREGLWLNLNFTMPDYTRSSQKSCLYEIVEHYRPVWGQDPDPDPVDESLPSWAQMVITNEPLEDRHRSMRQWTAADIKAQNSGGGREVCIIERRTAYIVYDWRDIEPPEGDDMYLRYHRWVRRQWPIPMIHGDALINLHISHNRGRENRDAQLGRYIPEYRSYEVSLRDGQDDQPFWIVLGEDIFDITNWTSPYVTEEGETPLHQLLRSVPGGSPAHEILLSQYDLSEVKGDLWPNRIGTVWSGEIPVNRPFNVYTRREVAAHRYLNKECPLGAYIIIWNNVYDVTEWARLHPAGIELVAPYIGKDATYAFRKNHMYLPMLSAIEHVRIGRIVPEHDPDDRVPPHTFAHHDTLIGFQPEWIKNTLSGDTLAALHDAHLPWEIDGHGLFMNQHVWGLNKMAMITEMKVMKELITHKLYNPPFVGLAQILPEKLTEFNGERLNEWTITLSYVAANNWVYDVTNVMRYGLEEEQAKLRPWLGGVIEDEGTRSWVIETFEFAVIAQLVDEITEDPDEFEDWDPRLPDHNPDQTLKKITNVTNPQANKRKRQDEEQAEAEPDIIAPIKKQRRGSENSDASDNSFVRYFNPPADDPAGNVGMWGSAMMARFGFHPDNGDGDEQSDDPPNEPQDPWSSGSKGHELVNKKMVLPPGTIIPPSDFDPLDIRDERESRGIVRDNVDVITEGVRGVDLEARINELRAQVEALRMTFAQASSSSDSTPEISRAGPSNERESPRTPTRDSRPLPRTPSPTAPARPPYVELPRENLPPAKGWLSGRERRQREVDEVLYREQAPAPRIAAATTRPMGPAEVAMLQRTMLQIDEDREKMSLWKDARENQSRPSLDRLTQMAIEREKKRNEEMEEDEKKKEKATREKELDTRKEEKGKGPDISKDMKGKALDLSGIVRRPPPPPRRPRPRPSSPPRPSPSLPVPPTTTGPSVSSTTENVIQNWSVGNKVEKIHENYFGMYMKGVEELEKLRVLLKDETIDPHGPFEFANRQERDRSKNNIFLMLCDKNGVDRPVPGARFQPTDGPPRKRIQIHWKELLKEAEAEVVDWEERGRLGHLETDEIIAVLRDRFLDRASQERPDMVRADPLGFLMRELEAVRLPEGSDQMNTQLPDESTVDEDQQMEDDRMFTGEDDDIYGANMVRMEGVVSFVKRAASNVKNLRAKKRQRLSESSESSHASEVPTDVARIPETADPTPPVQVERRRRAPNIPPSPKKILGKTMTSSQMSPKANLGKSASVRTGETLPWTYMSGFTSRPEAVNAYNIWKGESKPSEEPPPMMPPVTTGETLPWEYKGGFSGRPAAVRAYNEWKDSGELPKEGRTTKARRPVVAMDETSRARWRYDDDLYRYKANIEEGKRKHGGLGGGRKRGAEEIAGGDEDT
ncbi:hypothetical protein ACHAQH_006707 [Verticillium albo-atrum]